MTVSIQFDIIASDNGLGQTGNKSITEPIVVLCQQNRYLQIFSNISDKCTYLCQENETGNV